MEERLKCPCCGNKMEKIDKDGIVIDRCSNCFGIWLDKGELDKIIMMRRDNFTKESRPKKYGYPRPGLRSTSEGFDWFYDTPQDDKSNLPSDG